ncbi:cytochrome b N-terminal domain-containing protein [Micromonospora chersina]|uniref:cytochrome b N-terminal domain-containing protein n=1 Tax=Micromonospora chersina TaxID=47854 RepID=UPI00367A2F06
MGARTYRSTRRWWHPERAVVLGAALTLTAGPAALAAPAAPRPAGPAPSPPAGTARSAFRKPRELDWLVGVTILTVALANGFTGYSMPDDLLSGLGPRTYFGLLVMTAGDDILARLLRVPVHDLLNLLRVLVLVLPLLADALAFLPARALRRADAVRLGELTRADVRAAARRPAGRWRWHAGGVGRAGATRPRPPRGTDRAVAGG